MNQDAVPESIGRRFHRPPVPSVIARGDLRTPLVFSHVASELGMPAPTLAPPVEDAFALHVHHAPLSKGDIWVSGQHRPLPRVRDGGVFVWDLRGEPTAQIHEAFEFSRFHIPRAAMDDLAYECGTRRPTDLVARSCDPDRVVQSLALAVVHRITLHGQGKDSLFMDGIALALLAHVTRTYGVSTTAARTVGSLAEWQVQRVSEWVNAHMGESVSIAELALLVDLSPSHFSRAFAKTVSMPPHRWLLRRRIERAKELLRATTTPLSDVAHACGFVDQSHFTNVFARQERLSPGRWRREVASR